MLEKIWRTVQDIWEFLNTPGKDLVKIPEGSLFAWIWKLLTTPIDEVLPGEAMVEFIEVACLLVGMVVMILVMLGARGKVAKCLYWSLALYFVLQILF